VGEELAPVVTVNVPTLPTVNVVWLALVMVGATGISSVYWTETDPLPAGALAVVSVPRDVDHGAPVDPPPPA